MLGDVIVAAIETSEASAGTRYGTAGTVMPVPPTDSSATTEVGVVILTLGNRPVELAAAVGSALDQDYVDVALIVVANGVSASTVDVPADERVTVVALVENAGIPGGRNVGAEHSEAELVAFLDDDARFVDATVLARCAEAFHRRPTLGAVALRIIDEDGNTERRHVPRIGARDPSHSGPVTVFLGGAVAIRAAAFRGVGAYPAEFVYAMEETDLALRLIDAGWEIHYDGAPAVFHPATDPGRHPAGAERTMRNRVWLAHRSLPAPIALVYVADWLVVSSLRRPKQARALLRAVLDGWRTRPGPRSPIRWRSVARLTRLGRPPII